MISTPILGLGFALVGLAVMFLSRRIPVLERDWLMYFLIGLVTTVFGLGVMIAGQGG